jgi:hypothetical protein
MPIVWTGQLVSSGTINAAAATDCRAVSLAKRQPGRIYFLNLLMTERDHRINARRLSGGHVTGQKRGAQENRDR